MGADASNPHAVARIFEIKGRPRFDPLIVHVAEMSWLSRIVTDVPPAAELLTRHFWPGPLSLVLPKTSLIPDLVTSGLPFVAVRIPNHPLALELLHAAGTPIAAPSANLFGRLSPTSAADVEEQLGTRIELILDGGPCAVGVESTVLRFGAGVPELLRPGGIPLEEIEQLIGEVCVVPSTDDPGSVPRPAPGMLPQHYAPQTPLTFGTVRLRPSSSKRVGLLAFQRVTDPERWAKVEILSPSGDLREAAAGFFGALHRLDAARLDLIVAESFPESGLGRALNDRLRRSRRPLSVWKGGSQVAMRPHLTQSTLGSPAGRSPRHVTRLSFGAEIDIRTSSDILRPRDDHPSWMIIVSDSGVP